MGRTHIITVVWNPDGRPIEGVEVHHVVGDNYCNCNQADESKTTDVYGRVEFNFDVGNDQPHRFTITYGDDARQVFFTTHLDSSGSGEYVGVCGIGP